MIRKLRNGRRVLVDTSEQKIVLDSAGKSVIMVTVHALRLMKSIGNPHWYPIKELRK